MFPRYTNVTSLHSTPLHSTPPSFASERQCTPTEAVHVVNQSRPRQQLLKPSLAISEFSSIPSHIRMACSTAFRVDVSKKSSRTAKGRKDTKRRKLARQQAESQEESRSALSLPQSSTTQLSLPLRPATLAPSNDSSPSIAFSLPLRPAAVPPLTSSTSAMAFSLPMRAAAVTLPTSSTSTMLLSLPMRSATVVPPIVSTSNVLVYGFAQATIVQDHPFFGLPDDMGTEILSYLPLNQISSSRRCCQQFHGLVAQFEKHYAEPRIATYIIRLQNIIDTRENTRMPTDADTLLASLRI
jgi:hypothetical protein